MASPQTSNSFLWFTLGITAFVAGKAIQYALSDIISLTAINPHPSIEDPLTEPQPEETISLPTLQTLSTHPNHRIATAARTLIVQKFEATPNALRNLRVEAADPNPTRSKRAQTALKFLEEWGDVANTFTPGFDEEEVEGVDDQELEVSRSDLREMAMEMLRRRPPGAAGEDGMNDRLTSLAEELGVEGAGEMDYRRLLGNVRVLGGGDEGHVENARRLGVGNFAGLEALRGSGEEGREMQQLRRRARREAVVIQDDREDEGGREGRQRGWWVV